jgi:hypothetical protein
MHDSEFTPQQVPQLTPQPMAAVDENDKIKDSERIPIMDPIKVLRYRTLKKNNALGWWSAVVLVEDHGKKQICFYRWRKRDKEWKREKKISYRTRGDWVAMRDAIEAYIPELERETPSAEGTTGANNPLDK